jgi:hypothetical protein
MDALRHSLTICFIDGLYARDGQKVHASIIRTIELSGRGPRRLGANLHRARGDFCSYSPSARRAGKEAYGVGPITSRIVTVVPPGTTCPAAGD